MKEFFLILFFGKSILLTPMSIDIGNQWVELKLKKPLEVITSGASLEVIISRQSHLFNKLKGFNETYEVAKTAFPNGTIEAKLIDQNGNEIVLSRRALSISNNYVSYGVLSNVPLSTNIKINKLTIKSNIPIKGVDVYWRNYKH